MFICLQKWYTVLYVATSENSVFTFFVNQSLHFQRHSHHEQNNPFQFSGQNHVYLYPLTTGCPLIHREH